MTSPSDTATSMAPCPSVRVALVAKAEPAYYNRIKSNAILLVTVTAHLQCLSEIVLAFQFGTGVPLCNWPFWLWRRRHIRHGRAGACHDDNHHGCRHLDVFNVPNDPSRSGAAPVRVMGKMRLMVEDCFFVWGGRLLLWRWNPIACYVYTGAVVFHYATYYKRI